MRERALKEPGRQNARATFSIDLVLLTSRERELSVVLRRAPGSGSRERWLLPSEPPREDESLEQTARRIARNTGSVTPTWMEQVGAFAAGPASAEAELVVAYLALLPRGSAVELSEGCAWFPLSDLPSLYAAEREILGGASAFLRARMDHSPVAFRLLPTLFTLGELQNVYEVLLGRRLHKASFRRALQAASLVEATDEWRSEGRGRPAQLFRYAPRKRRAVRQPVRFDLLS